MQENVGKKATGLDEVTYGLIVVKWSVGTYRKCSHGIEGIRVYLGRNKRQNKIRNTVFFFISIHLF